ncbi:MAG: hypothetical protein ACR2HM_11100 [Acidimicrobiales bacterium]
MGDVLAFWRQAVPVPGTQLRKNDGFAWRTGKGAGTCQPPFIRRLVGEALEQATAIVHSHRDLLDWVASELITHETLREPDQQPFAEAVEARMAAKSSPSNGAEPPAPVVAAAVPPTPT